MNDDEFIKINELESSHWWYKSLHELVLNNISHNFNNNNIKILDAGCGTGGLMLFLKQNGYDNIEGFDISETAVKFAKKKSLNIRQDDMLSISNYYNDNSFDVIICNDVLYFLDSVQQKKVLENFWNILNKNGILIFNLPALNAFKGYHDNAVNINYRINKKEIHNIYYADKFKILVMLYWPFIISPVIWLKRALQRNIKKLDNINRYQSDLKTENSFINFICYILVKIENKIMKNKPFGSSLFIVLQKV